MPDCPVVQGLTVQVQVWPEPEVKL